MAGVRLRHKRLTNVNWVVMHPTRKYQRPFDCPVCKNVHFHKTYHIKIGADGTAIVSPDVFQRLRESGLPELEVVNEVSSPPAQTVGMDPVPVIEGPRYEVSEAAPGGRLSVLRNRLLTPRVKRYSD